jgi:hypothetical protein
VAGMSSAQAQHLQRFGLEMVSRSAAQQNGSLRLFFTIPRPNPPVSFRPKDPTPLGANDGFPPIAAIKTPTTVAVLQGTFRDWVAEETDYPGEVAEAALAHAIPNKVEAAYRRTDFLEKRRALMSDWGAFCIPAKLAAVA